MLWEKISKQVLPSSSALMLTVHRGQSGSTPAGPWITVCRPDVILLHHSRLEQSYAIFLPKCSHYGLNLPSVKNIITMQHTLKQWCNHLTSCYVAPACSILVKLFYFNSQTTGRLKARVSLVTLHKIEGRNYVFHPTKEHRLREF